MRPLEDRRRATIAVVANAFANRRHPGPSAIISPEVRSDEACEVGLKYRNLSWESASREILGHTADDLCFMTSEAFVYFLPAYLVEALDAYEDRDSSIPEDLVHQLTRNDEGADLRTKIQFIDGIREGGRGERTWPDARARLAGGAIPPVENRCRYRVRLGALLAAGNGDENVSVEVLVEETSLEAFDVCVLRVVPA